MSSNRADQFGEVYLNGEKIDVGPHFTPVKFANFLSRRGRYKRLMNSPDPEIRREISRLYREAILVGIGRA